MRVYYRLNKNLIEGELGPVETFVEGLDLLSLPEIELKLLHGPAHHLVTTLVELSRIIKLINLLLQ